MAMGIGEYFLEAFESLSSNKLRSGLTILGIVIGVAAVIAMLAVGNGAQASINQSIESIGTNLLFVTSGAQNVRVVRPLTLNDVSALQNPAQAPAIQAAAGTIQGRGNVSFGSESAPTEVVGVTPEFATLRNLTVASGEFITQSEVTGRFPGAVLGATEATNLFGDANPLNQTIQINQQPFRVIGVLQAKGGTGFGSVDDQVFVPLTTAELRLFHRAQPGQVDQILVQAKSASQVNDAIAEVKQIIGQAHHDTPGQEDFTVINEADVLSSAQSITGVLTIFLGGIAAISLLVGGIGIMNIMLVSVTERTREIGLRKALGARRLDIMLQFLIESAVLSLVGGIVGILVAWGITGIIARIASNSGTPFTPIIGINGILLATVFSAAVGLFFGFYPASRASGLEPVEALRYE
jgi:putative ABC transport system permease protein